MTTNNVYSFDVLGLNNTKEGTTSSTPITTPTRVTLPSPKQYSYYTDLCTQKRVAIEAIEAFTPVTMSTKISELLKYHPASNDQITLINNKIKELDDTLNLMSFSEEQVDMFLSNTENVVSLIIGNLIAETMKVEMFTEGLTGGREGTASKLINGLIDVEKQFTSQLPPTDAQLGVLVKMFYYPDAEFEEYGVPRRINLDEGLWRKPTPQEFADYIRDNMTKEEASAFIDKHRGGFYTWTQSRIRPQQLQYIQTLEARMCNDSRVSVIEQAVNLDGTISDVPSGKNESIVGTAYVPLTEEQLIMFSVEDASQFIDQLKAELEDRPATTLESTLEDGDSLRSITDISKQIEIEYQNFQDLMFSLEAVAGYNNDEVHEASPYNLVADDSPESNVENRLIIRNFMKEFLSTGGITFLGLLEMCSESVTAQRIILDM